MVGFKEVRGAEGLSFHKPCIAIVRERFLLGVGRYHRHGRMIPVQGKLRSDAESVDLEPAD